MVQTMPLSPWRMRNSRARFCRASWLRGLRRREALARAAPGDEASQAQDLLVILAAERLPAPRGADAVDQGLGLDEGVVVVSATGQDQCAMLYGRPG